MHSRSLPGHRSFSGYTAGSQQNAAGGDPSVDDGGRVRLGNHPAAIAAPQHHGLRHERRPSQSRLSHQSQGRGHGRAKLELRGLLRAGARLQQEHSIIQGTRRRSQSQFLALLRNHHQQPRQTEEQAWTMETLGVPSRPNVQYPLPRKLLCPFSPQGGWRSPLHPVPPARLTAPTSWQQAWQPAPHSESRRHASRPLPGHLCRSRSPSCAGQSKVAAPNLPC